MKVVTSSTGAESTGTVSFLVGKCFELKRERQSEWEEEGGGVSLGGEMMPLPLEVEDL